MFRKTAIAIGLVMVAGVGLAAEGGMSHHQMSHDSMSKDSMGHDQMSHGSGMEVGVNTGMSMDAQFNALDKNGDDAISRSEAQASSKLSAMYDSLDTSETIENRARESSPAGITRDQFEAGLQAAAAGGVVGPAVSGGTMHAMKDNSMDHDNMGKGSMSHSQMGHEGMSKDSMSHDGKMDSDQ